MSRLFGTDSARGIAVAELSCELAMQAGRAAAAVLARGTDKKSKIIVAKDKRTSSDILEAAVCAGICSAGADAETLGAVPVSAAAFLVKEHEADAGIMISAAHSGSESSGIRIFTPEGIRPEGETKELIEKLTLGNPGSPLLKTQGEMGKMLHCGTAAEEYINRLKSIPETRPEGIRVAVSCTDSCAEQPAVKLFAELGAEAIIVPEQDSSGDRIIGSESTKLEKLMDFVTENGCGCGLAIDGDGGGCLAVDENGTLVDGDSLLSVFAKDFKKRGILRHDSIAVPLTSSLGLMSFARENEIGIVTSGASDRYVLDRMREGGYNLGGEKSGRIIFADDLPCEDGLLTGIRLLEIMKRSGKRLSELSGEMRKLPEIVLNVRISPHKKEIWKNDSEITDLIERHETALGNEGRLIVRESGGSDPFIRVIAEGRSFGQLNSIAMEIAQKIKARCGYRR